MRFLHLNNQCFSYCFTLSAPFIVLSTLQSQGGLFIHLFHVNCDCLWAYEHHQQLPLPMFLSILPFFPVSMARRSWILIPWGQGFSLWSLHVLHVSVWVLSVKNGWMMSCVDALLSTFTECFSVNKLKSIRHHCSFSLGPYFFPFQNIPISQCWCNRCWWDVSQRHYRRPKNNTPAFIHPTGFPDYPL